MITESQNSQTSGSTNAACKSYESMNVMLTSAGAKLLFFLFFSSLILCLPFSFYYYYYYLYKSVNTKQEQQSKKPV